MFKSIFAASVAAVSIAVPVSAQVTSVSQLSDVQPTSWSYQALSNLISQYNCVAGYPGGTFKPGQAATRAQMAALVDACLSRVTEYQSAEDARLAAALKEQAAQWKGTQVAVAQLQLAAEQKKQGVGNYVGLGVLLNQQGTAGNGQTANKTVGGGTLQMRYAAKTFSNQNAVSVRPYLNAVAGPSGNIGTAGGALVSYDFSLARKAGVSAANLYAGAGYQVPFTQYNEANYQSAVGSRGQFVFAVGIEGRITNSLTGFMDLKFPTTNAANSYNQTGGTYSPVLTTGVGVRF